MNLLVGDCNEWQNLVVINIGFLPGNTFWALPGWLTAPGLDMVAKLGLWHPLLFIYLILDFIEVDPTAAWWYWCCS